MNISKAVSHFLYKLNPKNRIWKATPSDQEAINTIIDFVESKHAKDFNDHQLYAKLYITYLAELMKYYKATVFDGIPQKELHKILDQTLEQIIENFVKTATDIEQSLEYEIDGVLKHPMQLTKEQKDNVKIINPVMTYEQAKNNLTSLINLSINEFS